MVTCQDGQKCIIGIYKTLKREISIPSSWKPKEIPILFSLLLEWYWKIEESCLRTNLKAIIYNYFLFMLEK